MMSERAIDRGARALIFCAAVVEATEAREKNRGKKQAHTHTQTLRVPKARDGPVRRPCDR